MQTRSVNTFCISFSLGCHLCGFIGQEYKLTGIIALDPSNKIFDSSSDDGRLSKDDADAVVVFHTGYGFIGIKEPFGDVDFYVNGGRAQEVACGTMSTGLGSRNVRNNCHHMYALFDLYRFALGSNRHCATNVYCPLQHPSSIKGIKFPEIDVKNQVVKNWTTIEERSSFFPTSKQVGKAVVDIISLIAV